MPGSSHLCTCCQRLLMLFVFSKQCVTLRRVPDCVTALIFTHQSWAPNWYSPSLINALHCKSFTALRSLFILFCHSAHQTGRSDMSVMVHLNAGTWMTACVAPPPPPPFEIPFGEKQRRKLLLAQVCIIKSWKHSAPSWPVSTIMYVEWAAAWWHCSEPSAQHKHRWDGSSERGGTKNRDQRVFTGTDSSRWTDVKTCYLMLAEEKYHEQGLVQSALGLRRFLHLICDEVSITGSGSYSSSERWVFCLWRISLNRDTRATSP